MDILTFVAENSSAFTIILLIGLIAGLAMQAYNIIKITRLDMVVSDNLYNNVYSDFHEELNLIIKQIPQTEEGNCYVKYLRNQLNHIYDRYMDAKKTGSAILTNPAFFRDLLGSTSSDLRNVSPNFTETFIEIATNINKKNVKYFEKLMLVRINEMDFRIALKESAKEAYKQNICELTRAFFSYQVIKSGL